LHSTSSALRKKGLEVCALAPKIRLGMQAQLIDTKNKAVFQTCILTKVGSPGGLCLVAIHEVYFI
ncbi:hypothetical protein, partial [Microcoleus sp.]|uniref:hypothetical protein n=1 Tax=Microcoleus sp. TaxID=44472 RepID=UPI00403EC476